MGYWTVTRVPVVEDPVPHYNPYAENSRFPEPVTVGVVGPF